MKRRRIHSTDIEVSSLGLGTVKFGRNTGVKYPTHFDLPSDQEVLDLLDLSSELGINLLDTAPAYGSAEERLGKLLGDRRDQWVISSKAGEDFVEGQSRFDFSEEAITSSVERSLRRLRTDRLESLLLHSDGNDIEVLEHAGAVTAMHRLKEEGKVLSIGISTKTVPGGLKAIEFGLDTLMIMFNPWETAEEPVLKKASETGTSIFIKKALGSGWFGKEEGAHPVREAYEFIFDQKATTSIIVGTLNLKHLRENVDAINAIEA